MGLSNYTPSSRISQSGVCTSGTRPATPYAGQVIYESDTKKTLIWNGSLWTYLSAPPPQVTLYTSGSGTYTVPSGCQYLKIQLVGGGGGGAGSGGPNGGGNAGQGGTGGTTTFGSSLLSATGGVGGYPSSAGGGAGGSGTVNSPAIGFVFGGTNGTNLGQYNTAQQVYTGPAAGPPTPLGAYGAGGNAAGTGGTAVCLGGSGGAGGYVEAFITSPSATYAYAVGAGGTAGAAGTNGFVGLVGGSGAIYITAF